MDLITYFQTAAAVSMLIVLMAGLCSLKHQLRSRFRVR